MLVLSRQRDQTIMIGDDIEVTVVDIRGDKVRLGITAPKTVSVHRKEVYEAIRRENRAAGRVGPVGVVPVGVVPVGIVSGDVCTGVGAFALARPAAYVRELVAVATENAKGDAAHAG